MYFFTDNIISSTFKFKYYGILALKPSSTTLSKSPSVMPIIGILNLYKISEAINVVSSPTVTTKSASLN